MCGIGAVITSPIYIDPILIDKYFLLSIRTRAEKPPKVKSTSKTPVNTSQKTPIISTSEIKEPTSHEAYRNKIESAISSRGPDGTSHHEIKHTNTILSFCGAVLALRNPTTIPSEGGEQPYNVTKQPQISQFPQSIDITDRNINMFLWNGEVFGSKLAINLDDNDTTQIFRELEEKTANSSDAKTVQELVFTTISQLKGPFSVIFYHYQTNSIHFARDRLGKRSLLLGLPKDELNDGYFSNILLSSSSTGFVTHEHKLQDNFDSVSWYEVPVTGMFSFAMNSHSSPDSGNLLFFSWEQILNDIHNSGASDIYHSEFGHILANMKHATDAMSLRKKWLDDDDLYQGKVFKHAKQDKEDEEDKEEEIKQETQEKLSSSPIHSKEFTVDSFSTSNLPFQHPITVYPPANHVSPLELYHSLINHSDQVNRTVEPRNNVANIFSKLSPSNVSEILATLRKITSIPYSTNKNATGVEYEEKKENVDILQMNHTLPTTILASPHVQFYLYLVYAVYSRVQYIPRSLPLELEKNAHLCDDAKISILYSGGVDCTVLASISHQQLPITEPIELINVAFVGPRKNYSLSTTTFEHKHHQYQSLQPNISVPHVITEAPDRVAAIHGYKTLCKLHPSRTWKLILVNITSEDIAEHRKTITSLISPTSTIMDFNIGTILYFASRGIGLLYTEHQKEIQCNDGEDDGENHGENLGENHEQQLNQCNNTSNNNNIDNIPGEPDLKQVDIATTKNAMRIASEDTLARIADQKRLKEEEKAQKKLIEQERVQKIKAQRKQAYLESLGTKKNEPNSSNACAHEHDDSTNQDDRMLRKSLEKLQKQYYKSFKAGDITKAEFQEKNADVRKQLYQLPSYEGKKNSTINSNTNESIDVSSDKKQLNIGNTVDQVKPKIPDEVLNLQVTHAKGKVLILGSGADELFGGYGRHLTAVKLVTRIFDRQHIPNYHDKMGVLELSENIQKLSPELQIIRTLYAEQTLKRELTKDISRIWARNLGRDDRVLSIWGKEARHPFLDEDFCQYMTRYIYSTEVDNFNSLIQKQLPVQYQENDIPSYFSLADVFDASLSPGIGDKKCLREVALALGHHASGRLLKRAMQFGTKIVNKQVVGTVQMTNELNLDDILNPQLMKDK